MTVWPARRAIPKSMIFAGRPSGYEDVGRLDVPVDDALLVGVGEAGEGLEDHVQKEPGIGPEPVVDRALEIDALQPLEGHVGHALVLAQLVHHDDVGVLDLRRRTSLAQEPGAVLGAAHPLRHDLERHLAVEALVAAEVDRPHGPLPELAHDAIAADLLRNAHGGMISSRAVRAVVQRASEASVRVDGEVVGRIGPGLVVLLGVGKDDAEQDADVLADKVLNLRVFPDETGQMNRSVLDVGGGLLVISQFTLMGDARKGRRPSYIEAAAPDEANRLYEHFVGRLRPSGLEVATGVFRAMMDVALVNAGPGLHLHRPPYPSPRRGRERLEIGPSARVSPGKGHAGGTGLVASRTCTAVGGGEPW